MRRSASEIAAAVIRATSREKPADAALREELKRQRTLSPFDATEISHIVFRHYRWLGWLREERNLEAKFRRARLLEDQFMARPESIPANGLRANAVPAWVSDEMEVPDDWLRTLQQPPKIWLRFRQGQGAVLAKSLQAVRPPGFDALPETFIYEGETDLFKTPEFHAGEFEIQDIASQLVGFLCEPKPGETWWDACAGQGGKTLHLSDLMANRGLIWASDRAEWRLANLKRRAGRAKAFNYRSVMWDGGAKLPTKTKFDGVLVDAPCSGIGTWQRNPHARWTTDVRDVTELAAVQQQLLRNVAPAVKPGGKLIYSVCTLARKETEQVAADFAAQHAEFEPLELPWQKFGLRGSGNISTLWPQDLNGNGMFIAAWRRKRT